MNGPDTRAICILEALGNFSDAVYTEVPLVRYGGCVAYCDVVVSRLLVLGFPAACLLDNKGVAMSDSQERAFETPRLYPSLVKNLGSYHTLALFEYAGQLWVHDFFRLDYAPAEDDRRYKKITAQQLGTLARCVGNWASGFMSGPGTAHIQRLADEYLNPSAIAPLGTQAPENEALRRPYVPVLNDVEYRATIYKRMRSTHDKRIHDNHANQRHKQQQREPLG